MTLLSFVFARSGSNLADFKSYAKQLLYSFFLFDENFPGQIKPFRHYSLFIQNPGISRKRIYFGQHMMTILTNLHIPLFASGHAIVFFDSVAIVIEIAFSADFFHLLCKHFTFVLC